MKLRIRLLGSTVTNKTEGVKRTEEERYENAHYKLVSHEWVKAEDLLLLAHYDSVDVHPNAVQFLTKTCEGVRRNFNGTISYSFKKKSHESSVIGMANVIEELYKLHKE